MKPTKRPAREKEARKTEKEGRRESEKKKSKSGPRYAAE